MTFLKSCFNFKLFKESLKQQKYLMILHTILLFMITTLPALVIYNNSLEYNEVLETYDARSITQMLSGFNPYMMMLLTVAAVVTSIFCFNYLYKHQAVQFYHSMPHTRECIYISKFLSGVVSMLLPIIFIYAVNSIVYTAYGLNEFQPIGIMVNGLFTVMLLYICVFAVASFAAAVSGNFFAQLIMTAFVFLVYVASTMVIDASFQVWFQSLTIRFNYNEAYLFPPLVLVNGTLHLAECIFVICYTIFFFAAGLILFKFRKSESTGNFFAYKVVSVFLKYYVAFFASLLFGALFIAVGNGNMFISYIGYILTAFVVFIALQGIFGKSFKSMFTNMKSFVVFAVVICIVVSIPITMHEHFDNNIPEASNVDKLEVRMYNHGYSNEYVFEDYNNIAETLKLFSYNEKQPDAEAKPQKRRFIIERGTTGHIEINPDSKLYTFSYSRDYISNENYEKWFSKIYDTKEYKDYIIDCFEFRDRIVNGNITVESFHAGLSKHRTLYLDESSDSIAKENYEKLKNAFIKDFDACTYEDISNSYVYAVFSVRSTTLKIYKCYEATVKVLDEYFNENITINSNQIEKIEFSTWNYETKENEVIYVTTNQETIKEIMEYSVEFGNSVDAHVYYKNGESYGFTVNYDNLPAYIKNSLANN